MTPTREELLALAKRLDNAPLCIRQSGAVFHFNEHVTVSTIIMAEVVAALRQIAEAMEAVRKIEFFHDGLAADLHDVPDKTSAYVMGWDAALAAIAAAQQRKE